MRVTLFVAFSLQVWRAVTGYLTGAPVKTCVDMTPEHGVAPQSSASPYTITVSSTTFNVSQSVRVIIQGPVYTGLLLQARSGSSTKAVGTWGTPPKNTQYLVCSGNSQSAITHSNDQTKNNETAYTWVPAASLDSAFIGATVLLNKTTFWIDVKSEKLTRVPGNGTNTAADHKMAVTSVGFLSLLISAVFPYAVNTLSLPFS